MGKVGKLRKCVFLMCCLLHPQVLHRFPQEDNPDATQHWREATDFVCSFTKASGRRSSSGAHNVSDQENISFPLINQTEEV